MSRTGSPPPAHAPARIAGAGLALLLCLAMAHAARAEMTVFAGVAPVGFLAERIGGDGVRVHVLVPAGQSPHTFEPTPGQLSALAGADLYLAAGMPFESAWVPRLLGAVPGLRVATVAEPHGHDHETRHGDPAGDPHAWTSPAGAAAMAVRVRDAMIAADPAGEARYRDNTRALLGELEALEREVARMLAPVRGRPLVVYHPAWGALAGDFGLEQIAIERQGKAPGARHIVEVIERAREVGVCAVFVQPQVSRRAAEVVARAIGAEVVALDPMAPGLIANIRHVAGELAVRLGRPCPP